MEDPTESIILYTSLFEQQNEKTCTDSFNEQGGKHNSLDYFPRIVLNPINIKTSDGGKPAEGDAAPGEYQEEGCETDDTQPAKLDQNEDDDLPEMAETGQINGAEPRHADRRSGHKEGIYIGEGFCFRTRGRLRDREHQQHTANTDKGKKKGDQIPGVGAKLKPHRLIL